MRYAIYIRVSTDEQAKEGYSIEAQLIKLKAFVVSQDGTLDESCIYIDDGYSAKNMNRPAIKRLFKDAEKKKFDIVLVNSLDRWSRSLKDLLNSIDKLEKLGIYFKSATESIGTTTPQEKLMFNILGSFAQFEREINAERTRMSMMKRFLEGRHNTTAMLGYDFSGKGKDSKLVINGKEAEIVKYIFNTYLKEEIGLKSIAKRLNEKGILTKRGAKWDEKKVYKILINPIYCGYVKYKGEINKGIHQPIISEEVFNLVKAKLKERGKNLNIYKNQRKGKVYPICNHSENLLSGIAYCGICGSLLGKVKGKRWRYYQCNSKKNSRKCELKNVRADILENLVLKKIDELGNNVEEINKIKEEYFTKNQRSIEKIGNEIKELRLEMKELNLKVEKMVNWIMENELTKDESIGILEEINKVKSRLREVQEKVYEKEMELDKLKIDDVIFSQTIDYLKNFRFYYEGKPREEKQLLIKSVIKRVIVYSHKKIELKATLPLFVRKGSHLDVLARPRGDSNPCCRRERPVS